MGKKFSVTNIGSPGRYSKPPSSTLAISMMRSIRVEDSITLRLSSTMAPENWSISRMPVAGRSGTSVPSSRAAATRSASV